MNYSSGSNKLQIFKNLIGIKFEMYNALFASLPFHTIEKTGVLLSLFLLHCEEGFKKHLSPTEIVESFLKQYTTYKSIQDKTDLLFRFVQYSERQVVLFDALEDASFRLLHDMNGPGTIRNLQTKVVNRDAESEFNEKLKDFSVRLVLTAHPTQFYPSEVLGIIHDLAKALASDNTSLVNSYLQQLGKTPFFKKAKPSPYDEAISLIWFLENVFFQAAGHILSSIKTNFPSLKANGAQVLRMGFWPGGDRDGNPYVNANTTLNVAEALRGSVLKSYYIEVRKLKRRLTFRGVATPLAELEEKLYNNLFIPGHKADINKAEIVGTLQKIKNTINKEHDGLFANLVDDLISKVELFGLFFASLDIRQDSSIHGSFIDFVAENTSIFPKNFKNMDEEEKIAALLKPKGKLDVNILENDLFVDTVDTINAIKTIQKFNGEEGCHRYIISHSTSALNIIEVYSMFLLSGWKKDNLSVDFVPLFETIDDLRNAGGVMEMLYNNEVYRKHLSQRNDTQTIMLGFSDGTKDGGYLMANWSIYKAKEELTRISRENGVEVIFFDGRGGPPARGGGKTHQFYASMGHNITSKEIQLTVQGQTVSSNFGTIDSAQFNMEQMIHAGVYNALFSRREQTLTEDEEVLVQMLADESYNAYNKLKTSPNFLEYLNNTSPLRYYAETNIASRPSKRKSGKLNLNDLRAVPYVGSWSQIKQNLPGYYGVGSAMEKLEAAGKWPKVKSLYNSSLFFKTLLDNSEMAMNKCFFPLTEFLADHPTYGELWNVIHDEYQKTRKYVLKLSGSKELMGDKPVDQLSIQMRQRIELPLITMQQYALTKLREMDEQGQDKPEKKIYENLVMRCSFGIINAERNSA